MIDNKSNKSNIWINFLAAGLAGMGAVTFTNPFEVAKTRLQLQGELKLIGHYNKAFNGVFDTIYKTAYYEGIFAVQKGLGSAYLFQVATNGIRIGSYDTIGMWIKRHTDMKGNSNLVNMFIGGLCGYIGAILGTPFQLIKTRIQSNAFEGSDVNFRYDYRNTFDGLRRIFKENGIRGLFAGSHTFGMRMAMGSAVQLASYDFFKYEIKAFKPDYSNSKIYLISSFSSGILTCLIMNPFDIMCTRVFNQKYENGRGLLYKGFVDCCIKTYRIEGFFGFYKGLTALVLRLIPHGVIAFTFLEHLKNFFRKNWM